MIIAIIQPGLKPEDNNAEQNAAAINLIEMACDSAAESERKR